ncbi:MAG: hypothetical protein HXX13_04015 [Bacteroidetes bacterium]|nr:hypothetical protein [Bacteroidota bacterium]
MKKTGILNYPSFNSDEEVRLKSRSGKSLKAILLLCLLSVMLLVNSCAVFIPSHRHERHPMNSGQQNRGNHNQHNRHNIDKR